MNPALQRETCTAGGADASWRVWQLVDSALPTGGFAHSSGLEAAWQHGEVRTPDRFREWLSCSLVQMAKTLIPWVNEAYRAGSDWEELDRHCEAFTTNHVANRASRLQGRALLAAAERIFDLHLPIPPFGHHAPVFGRVLRELGVAHPEAVRMLVFGQVRGVVAAAVRLNIVGSMEAQRIQFEMGRCAEGVVLKGLELGLDDLAQTSPLIDLWQGAQDRLYSRLFQS